MSHGSSKSPGFCTWFDFVEEAFLGPSLFLAGVWLNGGFRSWSGYTRKFVQAISWCWSEASSDESACSIDGLINLLSVGRSFPDWARILCR